MKRIIVLGVCFIISMLLIILCGVINNSDYIEVTTVKPQKTDYKITTLAKGVIKKSDEEEITLDYDIIIKKFNVKQGQFVKKGDILFYIDKDKTIELLKETYTDEQIDLYKDYIDNYPLEYKAEFDGKVEKVNKSAIIYSQNPIMVLSSGSGYIANLFINEKDISDINIGQKVIIYGDAFKNKKYNGVVKEIANSATTQTTGSTKETGVNVKVEFIDPDNKIKTGYNIKAEIITGTIKDALCLPYEAIKDDGNNTFVYKLNGKIFASKINIKVVTEDEEFVVVNGKINDKSKICITDDSSNDKTIKVSVLKEGIDY